MIHRKFSFSQLLITVLINVLTLLPSVATHAQPDAFELNPTIKQQRVTLQVVQESPKASILKIKRYTSEDPNTDSANLRLAGKPDPNNIGEDSTWYLSPDDMGRYQLLMKGMDLAYGSILTNKVRQDYPEKDSITVLINYIKARHPAGIRISNAIVGDGNMEKSESLVPNWFWAMLPFLTGGIAFLVGHSKGKKLGIKDNSLEGGLGNTRSPTSDVNKAKTNKTKNTGKQDNTKGKRGKGGNRPKNDQVENIRKQGILIKNLKRENEEVRKQLEKVRKEQEKELDELNKQLDELNKQLTDVKAGLDEKLALENNATDQINDLEKRAESLQEDIVRWEASYGILESRLDRVVRESDILSTRQMQLDQYFAIAATDAAKWISYTEDRAFDPAELQHSVKLVEKLIEMGIHYASLVNIYSEPSPSDVYNVNLIHIIRPDLKPGLPSLMTLGSRSTDLSPMARAVRTALNHLQIQSTEMEVSIRGYSFNP